MTTVLVLRGGGYEKNFLLPEGIGVKGAIALGLVKAGIAWWCHWVADKLHRRGHTRFAKIIAAVEMALPAVGVVNNSAILLRR